MKRKFMIIVCGVLILCALTGCQLAREDEGTGDDKLVGMFITTEYLDLFDFESYFNDNLGSFKSDEVTVGGNTQKYEGRLYATLTTRTLTNEETGKTSETEEYVFEGVAGIPYFSVTMSAAQGRDSYQTSISDPAISDGHMSLHYGDDENRTTLEGTIYTAPSSELNIYYFNPVYQSADGRVYATSGSGFMVNNEGYSEGSAYYQTLEATTTVTENGKAKTESISVTVSISVMLAPEKIVVLQMDTDSRLLSRTEYAPDAMPDALKPEADTAYIIVETCKRDDMGSLKISRDIYGREAENIVTFFARDDGICVKHWTLVM